MVTDAPESIAELLRRLLVALRARFSLADDRASDADIDERIRADVEMKGTNLWVLIFAIFIASIGLNVNSTAVIIGAMLISPLMGPIAGLGFGIGTFDLKLVRAGLLNLAVASLIALLTSTAYFAITPLHEAHSELLSRTTPTIWDVLVALFGGLAGIVATTRKRQSNVVPGVAIATALMPPLCAAGYGLASGVWSYFFGAFYLFTINCVFIAASAALITRAFRIHAKVFVDRRLERRVRSLLGAVVAVTMLPSLYLAYRLVGDEVYRARASLFVSQELQFQGTRVSDVGIDPQSRRIEVSLIGNIVSPTRLAEVRARLASAGLAKTDLEIFQAGSREIDIASLRSGLLSDLYRDSQNQNAAKDATIRDLRNELSSLKASTEQYRGVPAEIAAIYPQINSVLLARAPEWDAATGYGSGDTLLFLVTTGSKLSLVDRRRLDQWLQARTGATRTQVIVQTP
jgi:uncharacterized hydrophobic protein (TIGR00271 family)